MSKKLEKLKTMSWQRLAVFIFITLVTFTLQLIGLLKVMDYSLDTSQFAKIEQGWANYHSVVASENRSSVTLEGDGPYTVEIVAQSRESFIFQHEDMAFDSIAEISVAELLGETDVIYKLTETIVFEGGYPFALELISSHSEVFLEIKSSSEVSLIQSADGGLIAGAAQAFSIIIEALVGTYFFYFTFIYFARIAIYLHERSEDKSSSNKVQKKKPL